MAPAPLQGLHRYYEPVRPVRRIGTLPLTVAAVCGPPSRDQPAHRPIAAGRRYRDDRFSCSMPAPATSSRHLYSGHHQGNTQAVPWLRAHHPGRALVPGARIPPGFDAIIGAFDASAVVQTRSSSRRSPDPLTAGRLPQRSPPRLLTTAACGGLGSRPAGRTRRTSITGAARFVLATFYIASLPFQDTRPLGSP